MGIAGACSVTGGGRSAPLPCRHDQPAAGPALGQSFAHETVIGDDKEPGPDGRITSPALGYGLVTGDCA
jgi:hypothetical protein